MFIVYDNQDFWCFAVSTDNLPSLYHYILSVQRSYSLFGQTRNRKCLLLYSRIQRLSFHLNSRRVLLTGLSASAVKPLQLIHNVARRVLREPNRAHVTTLLISILWLKVANWIKFKSLMRKNLGLHPSVCTQSFSQSYFAFLTGTPSTSFMRVSQSKLFPHGIPWMICRIVSRRGGGIPPFLF